MAQWQDMQQDAKIFDCASEVAFTNNGKYVYGFWGMCGYAEDTMIEYCASSGAITVTGDMGSLYLRRNCRIYYR